MPRDASEQFKCGEEVALDQVRLDDVAFFANAEGKITHVGVCDGDGQVIHASGEVRIITIWSALNCNGTKTKWPRIIWPASSVGPDSQRKDIQLKNVRPCRAMSRSRGETL